MRIEKRLIVASMIVLVPGLLCSAQESQRGRRRAESQTTSLNTAPESAREMRIFALRYHQVDLLGRILIELIPNHEATMVADAVSNKLIVTASLDRMQQIQRVLEELDVPQGGGLDAQQMMYRVYMLEPPSKFLGLKPFSITMTGSSQLPPDWVLNTGARNQTQIEVFRQVTWSKGWRTFITGRAASNEAVERLTEKIPDCQITDLEWEDDTPIMPITQVAPLPGSLQEHVRKFLGEGTGIVGYWFGNLSVPGTVRAPIGPWGFEMSVNRSTQEDEVELEISVTRELPGDPSQTLQILSNSIRGKIDRPVIIGYNRDNRGVQTMGALVVVPEAQ